MAGAAVILQGNIVPSGTDRTTISGRLQDDCCGCGDAKFAIEYEPGKTVLTQSEFDRIVAEFNSAVKKPGWWYPLWPLCMLFHCFTCHGCDPHRRGGCCDFALDKVAEQMNTQYANRGVQFTIKTRLEPSLWAAIPICGDCCDVDITESYFLVIQQQASRHDLRVAAGMNC